MALEEEIQRNINEIKTDSYSMSIGELANIYNDDEINISPSYQRYFRWNLKQKSDLIESIILGIPIPPVFVAQESDGKWNVIDGLQRISTILEFMGELRVPEDFEFAVDEDEENEEESEEGTTATVEVSESEQTLVIESTEVHMKKLPQSKLISTKYLPSLEGVDWGSLTSDIRRKIKRGKLDIIIIDSTENPKAKYEMFQRLNTNISELKPQELRNCLMAMIRSSYLDIINAVSTNTVFKKIIKLTKKQIQEQFDKELVVRYLVSRYIDTSDIDLSINIRDYFTEELINMMEDNTSDINKYGAELIKSLQILDEVLGDEVFKKSNAKFSLSMYEAIITGLAQNIDYWETKKDELNRKVEMITNHQQFVEATKKGQRAITRFKILTDLSKEMYETE
ncbi:DUF262 domain-containing protein [Paenibacillus sp. FSL E2-0201]|uniref:DUF262 domain-containing protein n=1 Tax=Paenibacillus sp. FSL E2-0201 TaxID=2954726 RepID=UPI0030DD65B9